MGVQPSETLDSARVVVLHGARQSGKTTLARRWKRNMTCMAIGGKDEQAGLVALLREGDLDPLLGDPDGGVDGYGGAVLLE